MEAVPMRDGPPAALLAALAGARDPRNVTALAHSDERIIAAARAMFGQDVTVRYRTRAAVYEVMRGQETLALLAREDVEVMVAALSAQELRDAARGAKRALWKRAERLRTDEDAMRRAEGEALARHLIARGRLSRRGRDRVVGHRPRGRTARRRAASTTRDDGADPDPDPASPRLTSAQGLAARAALASLGWSATPEQTVRRAQAAWLRVRGVTA